LLFLFSAFKLLLTAGAKPPQVHTKHDRGNRIFRTHYPAHTHACSPSEKDFFIDYLLVRIHFITEVIHRTGLVPWVSPHVPTITEGRGGGCG